MLVRTKLLIAAPLAALLLAAAVSTATANHLSISEQRFKTVYSPISFIPSFGATVRCPVTLEGSFHARTSAKTAGALSGFISRASIGTCESGRARINLETLPWHIQYGSFAGTLPNITSITQYTIRPSWEISGEIFGLTTICRYTPPRQGAVNTRELRGVLTQHTPNGESAPSETMGCPEGRVGGTARIVTPTGGNITVSLI